MKKTIIISVTICLTVMVASTLSNKILPGQEAKENARTYGQPESISPQTTFYYSQWEHALSRIEDPNLLTVLTDMYSVNRENLQRIFKLENRVKLLEEKLEKFTANERRNLFQQKRLESQLNYLKEKRY